MLWDIARLLLGGLLLYYGAEWLVRGSAGLARAFGLTPFVIGATVVAYGTSAPELTVGVAATLEGKGAIAVGNAVGSNIANIGLVLGITAVICPPKVGGGMVRRELPVLAAVTLLLVALVFDGHVGRIEAAVLIVGAVVFSVWMLRAKPAGADEEEIDPELEEAIPKNLSRPRLIGLSVVGLSILVGGGKVFVDGASAIAASIGMSERAIGLSVVAIGTSLPELAASLVAALRGHSDLAVGNVIGSNIFNILLIVGGAAMVRPISTTQEGLLLDLSVLVAITAFAFWSMRKERTITRLEGGLMMASYAAFMVAMFVTQV